MGYLTAVLLSLSKLQYFYLENEDSTAFSLSLIVRRDKVCKMSNSTNCTHSRYHYYFSTAIYYKIHKQHETHLTLGAWKIMLLLSDTLLLLSLAYSKFGDANQQFYYLKTHSRVYITESKVWEVNSFPVNEVNHQIIENI